MHHLQSYGNNLIIPLNRVNEFSHVSKILDPLHFSLNLEESLSDLGEHVLWWWVINLLSLNFLDTRVEVHFVGS
jgi:uncharacterized membrane protein YagU involved in acid resistance